VTEISEAPTPSKTWEPFTEERTRTWSDGQITTNTLEGMRRSDGLEILREEIAGREGVETFRVRWKFGEIRIVAHKGGCLVSKFPPSTYIIEVNQTKSEWPGEHSQYPSIIQDYARDLKDALLNFPPSLSFQTYKKEKTTEVLLNNGTRLSPQFMEVEV